MTGYWSTLRLYGMVAQGTFNEVITNEVLRWGHIKEVIKVLYSSSQFLTVLDSFAESDGNPATEPV